MKLGNEGVIVVGGWKGTQLLPTMIWVPLHGPPHATTCTESAGQSSTEH